jgi:hypothetical protein
MAGTLVIDTLNASSGPLQTNNGMSGIAKAWVCMNGSTGAIIKSFNVSSITKNGTGDITITFTTAMADALYTMNGNTNNGSTPGTVSNYESLTSPTTTAVRIATTNYTTALADYTKVMVVIHD